MSSPRDLAKSAAPASAAPVVRPAAVASIEPMGRQVVPGGDASAREHLVKVVVELSGAGERRESHERATQIARRVLAAYEPPSGERDRRQLRDVTSSARGKGGALTTVVVAVEATVVWPGRPADEGVAAVRALLVGEGYRTSVRERRECAEGTCATDALVDWQRPDDVPMGWFSSRLCGRHDFRRCAGCGSIFRLSSTNAAGQAPSVHCEVCGAVLVEWGSSKVWTAELVERRTPGAAR